MPRVPVHNHTGFNQGGRLAPGAVSGPRDTSGGGGSGGGGGSESDVDPADFLTVIDGGGDTVSAHGSAGSTETIDPADGNVHTLTLTAACTITLTAPASGPACTIEVYALQDGTGGWAITWPGSVLWPGGTTPTPTPTAASLTRYVLETLDGGTTWYGVMVGGSGTGVTYGTPAIVLGTVATAGSTDEAIRRDSTIVAFDATVPVTQAYSDAAATGSAAVAARRDHKHGMPASGTGIGEILISDTPSTPLVFADLIQTEAQDDLVYADP